LQLLTDLIMAQNKETRLWHELKDLDKNWHFTRIESSTVNGIPDVHCVVNRQVFWIELKANASKNCGLSKYQINWHIKYLKAGGAAYILILFELSVVAIGLGALTLLGVIQW
jgi:Holliday junction resolvase